MDRDTPFFFFFLIFLSFLSWFFSAFIGFPDSLLSVFERFGLFADVGRRKRTYVLLPVAHRTPREGASLCGIPGKGSFPLPGVLKISLRSSTSNGVVRTISGLSCCFMHGSCASWLQEEPLLLQPGYRLPRRRSLYRCHRWKEEESQQSSQHYIHLNLPLK